jgi:hypothetical protein
MSAEHKNHRIGECRWRGRRACEVWFLVCCGLLGLSHFLVAAEPDLSKLPKPLATKIDFDKDIKPILEQNCFRCHGPERPKSHLRLDSRESALKGGDNGVDILPGDGTHSPLIHYVARLVADMEMPPVGKGDPLTPEQVATLRAWIDQGVVWGATNQINAFAFSASPTLRWISVQGDKQRFREIEGMREGFGGGVEHFNLEQQIAPDTKISAEGRVLFPDRDVQLKLGMDKKDVGFVHAGFEQWRRYYDDTGGYYRGAPVTSFNLNQDLQLDIGRAWIDFGLTRPDLPQMVVGYEYQFRDGGKATLDWGAVSSPGLANNIYPAFKDIHEHVHVAKLDITHTLYDWHLEDSARVEIYENSTMQQERPSYSLGGPEINLQTRERASHVQGMNAIRAERQIEDWWLFTAGYLYSRLDGDTSFNQQTVNPIGVPMPGQFWSSDLLALRRDSHIVSAGSLFLPIDWLSASVGVQSEWTHQEGSGRVNLDQDDPTLIAPFTQLHTTVRSDLDDQKVSESLLLRMSRIPHTILFAEGRFSQDRIGQFEQDLPLPGYSPDDHANFLRDTDYFNDLREFRAGFDTSPWSRVSFNAHYKRRTSDSDYDNRLDLMFTNQPAIREDGVPNPGYSAFIRHRGIDTDETQAKLVFRPNSWLKTTLTYQLVSTEYTTVTDPVPGGGTPSGLTAGKYDAHVYGLMLTVMPFQRCYFNGTFTYSDSRTWTAHNDDPSLVPYKGNVYNVMASMNYALDENTSLQTAYLFSKSEYGENNISDGLPLGLDYTRHGLSVGLTRKINRSLTANWRYAFYQYWEPTSGGANNYTAHGVFATLVMRWP